MLADDDVTPGERAAIARNGARLSAVLRLLGLFDRPAEMELLDILRAEPPIPGLTEPLVGLSEADWNRTLFRLSELRLVSEISERDTAKQPLHERAQVR